MSKTLRIAVAGAGVIGRKHIQLMTQAPLSSTITLGAIVDPMPAAQALAATHGVPCFTDLAALFAGGQVDGVLLATPNALHAEGVLACVERGLPTLVEKPVSDTLASAERMAEAAERTGVPVMVGHHRRHNPLLGAARGVVEQGRLGRVVAAHCNYLVHKPESYFQQAWRTQAGGGPLIINGIHDFDALRYILQPACGAVVEVSAMSSNRTRGYAVEDTAAVMLRLESGAIATLALSDAADSPWGWDLSAAENPDFTCQQQDCYFITGTEGSLSMPSMQMWRTADPAKAWMAPFVVDTRTVLRADPFVRQLEHFARVIRREEAPVVTLRDAALNLRIVEAIQRAVATGSTQPLSH